MKTTRYTLLAAALLLAASCANDPVEDIINPSAPGTALPGGTFVIDYTAGMEGADTRLTASERIQSLDYLIYQSTEDGTYTLLKKKTIPGINETTTWPLTRDNMTWEQREALKDTLWTNKYYKMVFVANADDDIWNEEGTPEESMFHALQNVVVDEETGQVTSSELEVGDKFNDGRLVLPSNGQFTDNNMYYMATLDVDGTQYATDEDKKTATLAITLQRMINKVEVKLADDVVNGIRTEGSVDEYVESKLGEYYDSYYANTNTKTGKLYEIAGTYLKKLDDNLDTEGLSDREVRYRDTKKFQDTYLGQTGKENFVSSINTCTESTCTIDNPYCVRQTFRACLNFKF